MAEYLRILWHHTLPDEPLELYYEVQNDRSVTRMIEVFEDGTPIADSLAIAAKREPNIVNNVCLCDGTFPEPREYEVLWTTTEFSYNPITKSSFDALFLRSNVKS
jgi:hypothetical protein